MPLKILETADFATLCQNGGHFVDKTGFLEQLLSDPGKSGQYLPACAAGILARPPGFGKSLLLSMLAEFCDITKDSVALFWGLQVYKNEELCRQWLNQYPVLFLSLADTGQATFARSLVAIRERMRPCATRFATCSTARR